MQCQSIAVKRLEPLGKPAVVKSRFQGLNMGPGYFVIAILGCADGGAQCTPVATAPTHYMSEEQCVAATPDALLDTSNLDYPTLIARCRSMKAPASANEQPGASSPEAIRRG